LNIIFATPHKYVWVEGADKSDIKCDEKKKFGELPFFNNYLTYSRTFSIRKNFGQYTSRKFQLNFTKPSPEKGTLISL